MKPTSQAGFTIFEIVIVVAMISILATIAVPNIQPVMAKYRLHGAARQLMADLMSTRMKSVSKNNEFKIFFTASDSQYIILDDNNNNGTVDADELKQTRDLRDTYRGINISKIEKDPIFYPRGTSSGTTITITNESGSKDISVNFSGRVKIN